MATTLIVFCNYAQGADLFGRNLTGKKTSIDQYVQELKIAKLSSQVLQKTIAAIVAGEYKLFDGTIGDCKCQTRTSMLLDFATLFKKKSPELQADFNQLQQIEQTATTMVDEIAPQKPPMVAEPTPAAPPTMSHSARQALSMKLKEQTLREVFAEKQLLYTPSPELKVAAQCFVTRPENQAMANSDLAKSTAESLVKQCKAELCAQSIAHEQTLAQTYCGQDVQAALTHVVQKGQTTMTGFFPAIKPVLAKMITARQAIQLQQETYCSDCSGLQDTSRYCFASDGQQFQPTKTLPPDEIVMVIVGNQYEGSLDCLKAKLGIDPKTTYIPLAYKKPCSCTTKPPRKPLALPVEEILLRGAAEHAQYITGEPIPFEKLGIQGSNLEQEYMSRRQAAGFGIENMACFCIDHIYPALPKR